MRCIELEMVPPAQKAQLTYSRSFSRKLTDAENVAQVLSIYAERVPGIRYARAGIVLTDIRAADGVQPLSLFREDFEGRGTGVVLATPRMREYA